jgi:hypothetical protein
LHGAPPVLIFLKSSIFLPPASARKRGQQAEVYLKAMGLPHLRQFPVDLPPLIMTSRDILGSVESVTDF